MRPCWHQHFFIYDSQDLRVTVNKEAVLRGRREPGPRDRWRILLQKEVSPTNSEYVLVSEEVLETVGNVYSLPSSTLVVGYLHACVSFPTKRAWMRPIKGGNFATWLHLTLKAIKKYFPDSNETWQGHVKCIKQEIRSTKQKKAPEVVISEEGSCKNIEYSKTIDRLYYFSLVWIDALYFFKI